MIRYDFIVFPYSVALLHSCRQQLGPVPLALMSNTSMRRASTCGLAKVINHGVWAQSALCAHVRQEVSGAPVRQKQSNVGATPSKDETALQERTGLRFTLQSASGERGLAPARNGNWIGR